jgi:alpha-glucosidase (family GH31 glycosyl hydrolase)/S-formylglutathione hydrolase FrmB
MFKKLVLFIVVFLTQNIYAQLTIIVNEVPKNTPKNAEVYISGDFENWSGGQEKYKLTKNKNKYLIRIPSNGSTINFKFTLGSWKTVETDANGASLNNRSFTFNKPNDTLRVQIACWGHLKGNNKRSSAAKNVTVLSKEFEISELNRKRRVRLYLPPGYHTSKEAYPVVYMHDGQNLFDTETSFSGEWSVDETLNKLYEEQNLKLIVVGIDNGGSKRLDEYSPWKNEKYGGGEGDAYLDFIVKKLKPYIDANYKTLTDKKNTAIIGSSMGGLISHYAALKFPTVFGKIGVYSPAFWFAPEIVNFSKMHKHLEDTKMYFLAGEKEGSNVAFNEISQTVKDMNKVVHILKQKGFPSNNLTVKVVPNGKHNEALWRNNFEETIVWLFKNDFKKRTFINAKVSKSQLKIKVSDGTYAIKFYTSNIAETTFIPKDQQLQEKKSHAVVLKSTYPDVVYMEDMQTLKFKTKDVSVLIKKKPFNISYWYKGKELVSEKNGYQRNDEFETLQFNLTPKEVLYGGGSRALGMNRRGHRLQLYNKAHYAYETDAPLMNFSMPIVMSSKKYMLHFDNAPIGYLDLDSKKNNTLTYETISGRKTYQIIAGDSWLNLIDNYTNLTGKQPLPPRWALGNFSSRFGYHSQKETVKTIDQFRQEKIPVDAVILDLYWFGKEVKGTMGNLEVFKDSFPDVRKMTADFRKKGVKTIFITEPFVLTTSKKWKEAVAKDILAKDSVGNPFTYDFFFGNTGLIDIYNPKGKKWFWNIYKEIKELGVDGFWGDLGEPEVHPSALKHYTGTADEVHNIYGHDWARLLFEGFQKEFPNERPFILMRAGYSGSQRFGMIPWSGDVNRTFGGLQSQPEIALQMGMQGMGYMHSDLGGFAGANLNNELYVRWLQYGVFQPIYRPHAQEDVPSEPVFRETKTKALAKKAIELRYSLLPYNYTLAFENNQTGAPLMRPLFFEESENEKLLTNATSYLWGNDFLITPILHSKRTTQEIYFPKKSNWFDFYTDQKVVGGQSLKVLIKKEYIPTYVRAGAFIPMAKPMQTTKAFNPNSLLLHYYHDPVLLKSKGALYLDDGLTAKAFEKGKYELLNFTSEVHKNSLKIRCSAKTGKLYATNTKMFSIIIHNMDTKPSEVLLGKEKASFIWNKKTKTVSVTFNWNTQENKDLLIQY